jgi:uracil phosphoribosyltransferase
VDAIDHPLVRHHLAAIRDRGTQPEEFRRLVRRLAVLLAYEATRDLPTDVVTVATPLADAPAERLRVRVGLVPILRAGLGMVDPVLDLLPQAEVWHLGVYRDEATARPVEYYRKIPAADPVDVALVLDPMLATGGSAGAAVSVLAAWGVPTIKLVSIIAARPGIDAVLKAFPRTQLFVAAIDEELNDRKFIVPGLGDAGDRQFNTPM